MRDNQRYQTLGEFIIQNQEDFKYSSGELSRLINFLRLAAKTANHEVNKAGHEGIIGKEDSNHKYGEDRRRRRNPIQIKSLKS